MATAIVDCGEGEDCPYLDSRIRHVFVGGDSGCAYCNRYRVAVSDLEAFTLYHNVFCSIECAESWREETISDLDPELCRVCEDREPAYAGVCLACLNEDREAKSLTPATECVICGGVFIPLNGEGTCSEPCLKDAKRELAHRRRARELDAFVADVDRAEVFERDGFVCQLCNLPIDMELVFPHRMFPTIDHVVPLAAGGTHEPGNVQAAHFACNASKGARV